MIIKQTKKETTVSPVIGVMLMLVVTIIIARIVAAFPSGIVRETTPASTVSIGLDDYDMGTLGYNGSTYEGFAGGYNESSWATYYNYAPYNMTLKHTGGAELDISDLILALTFNGATFTTSLSTVTDATSFSAGGHH